MGKQEFQKEKKVVYFPWRLHCEIIPKIKNDILASRRHTRGNSDTKILKSFEDPEKLFKRKNKEKLDFPLFGPSSPPDSHINPAWEINTAQTPLRTRSKPDLKNAESNPCRLRARSESDLKNIKPNPSKLESYLLDSLWKDLRQTSKAETTTSEHS